MATLDNPEMGSMVNGVWGFRVLGCRVWGFLVLVLGLGGDSMIPSTDFYSAIGYPILAEHNRITIGSTFTKAQYNYGVVYLRDWEMSSLQQPVR